MTFRIRLTSGEVFHRVGSVLAEFSSSKDDENKSLNKLEKKLDIFPLADMSNGLGG